MKNKWEPIPLKIMPFILANNDKEITILRRDGTYIYAVDLKRLKWKLLKFKKAEKLIISGDFVKEGYFDEYIHKGQG